jgi:porphobilinogen synthase
MAFPVTRLRRLRRTAGVRDLVRETRVSPADLIQPLFVRHGNGEEEIPSMPGQYHLSVDSLVERAAAAHAAGVPAVILFGLPARKDEAASEAFDDEGIVQMGIRALRAHVPDLVVVTDVCLCQYTSHGHCGILQDGEVANDVSLEVLADTAVSHARAGAAIVAPSDMMDGRVGAIRSALDAEGFESTSILAYSAKFASAFFGPFRDAAHSAPSEGDRRGYQMDPANGREAVREALLDIDEGADMVMVKPALPYLDVLRTLRDQTRVPLAAYQVSGEYAMIAAAAAQGLVDEKAAVLEALTAIRRAGADMVITYHAARAARWLS